MIDPVGDIYKCWVALSNSKYRLGNVSDVSKINEFLNARFLCASDYVFDKTCRECVFFPMCEGGCPLARLEANLKDDNDICFTQKRENLREMILSYIE